MNSKASSLRLQTLLSQSGVVSRRRAADWIAAGRVSVNGKNVLEPGFRVGEGDAVLLDGRELVPPEQKRYFLLNKPPGYLCSLYDPHGRPLVVDLLPKEKRFGIFPVGRLDYSSEGLLILTNDGYWAQALFKPRFGVEKEYKVTTAAPVSQYSWGRFSQGIRVDGLIYKAVNIRVTAPHCANVTLVEGKNREIRRAVQALGGRVIRLVRIRIAGLTLAGLERGRYRELTEFEVASFWREG